MSKKENQDYRTAKIVPTDPYICWITPCKECYYWNPDENQCDHPEVPPRQDV